jgi:hypothetical protein
MAGMDTIAPAKALVLGVLLSAANPKNLILVIGAATGLAQLGPTRGEAVVALAVFVAVGSLSVLIPVVYSIAGGEKASRSLDELKGWLALNNSAVMAVLFLVFGAVLIAKGLAPLSA